MLQAVFGRANANWAAPAYLTASILVTAWLLKQHRLRLLIAAIAVNLTLGILIYHTETLFNTAGYHISSKTDLRKRLRGWREIGQQFKAIQTQYPTAILLGDDRTILSHLVYHARPVEVMTWNPKQKIRHHYDLHGMLRQPLNKRFLFVSETPLSDEIRASFKTITPLKETLSVSVYPKVNRHYFVYYLQDFIGYSTRETLHVTP
jgi:hypothetical protein